MEKIETVKTDYYMTDDDINTLHEAFHILDRLTGGCSLSTKDYYFTSSNTNLTLSGDDLVNGYGAIDILVNYLLEDNRHISKVKSLKDFEEYHGFDTDGATR